MKVINYFRRQKAMLVSLLATAYIALVLPLYAFVEPVRMQNTELQTLMENLDSGMTIYAENCALCHGIAGEGIGANPPLDSPSLSEVDYATLFTVVDYGRYGTTMVGWGMENSGPLSDYEISQLVGLIQTGNWQTTQERVINLGLQPLIPFATEPDPEMMTAVSALPGGEVLAQGIALYAERCVSCHGADGAGTNIASVLNDADVRSKPMDELERAIVQGVPGTLMAGWQNILNEGEVNALLALIEEWDSIPLGTIPEPDMPVLVTEESLALGESLYTNYCSRCHAPEGQGTPRAEALNVKSFLTDTNDQAMQQIISLGVPNTTMLAWQTRLSEAEIQAIVGFIRLWEPTAPEVAEPMRGMGPIWQNESGDAAQGSGPPWMREGYPQGDQ